MACQGTLKCPKCDLLMRPPTSKGSKFNPSNHLYEHYMEFKRESEKDGRPKMVRCHSGAFATSVGQKRLTEERGRGGNIPQQSAYNLIYVSCFGKFRFRRKKDEEWITNRSTWALQWPAFTPYQSNCERKRKNGFHNSIQGFNDGSWNGSCQ